MKALYLSIFFLLMTGAAHAYDPEHYDEDFNEVETGNLDDDGDRNSGTQFNIDSLGLTGERANISYSTAVGADTFKYNGGGRIIDISQPPFNASPSNTASANSLAFQKAITFVVTQLYSTSNAEDSQARASSLTSPLYFNPATPGGDRNFIIYIPNGIYQVNDTLTYKTILEGKNLIINGAEISTGSENDALYVDVATTTPQGFAEVTTTKPASSIEAFARMRIIGQSRLAIIQATAPYRGQPEQSWAGKPVISFGNPDADYNSSVSLNTLRNLTIDAYGSGATGVQFSGANNSGMHNVWIKGGISTSGYGIYIKSAATQGYHNDITIDGFNRGIFSEPYHATHNTFEHITITNSSDSGIRTHNSGLSLRKVDIQNNTVGCQKPSIRVTGAAQVVLLDSTMHFGSTCNGNINNAIAISDKPGHVHARGIRLTRDGASPSHTYVVSDHSNFINGALERTLTQSANTTLAIEPANPSEYDYTGLSPVVFVGSNDPLLPDDAALDDILEEMSLESNKDNKYIIFFPTAKYTFNQQHNVPPNLMAINFLYGSFAATTGNAYLFALGDSSEDPLVIEDITSAGLLFEHGGTKTRPVIFRHIGGVGSPYRNITDLVQNVFFESVNGLGKVKLNGEPVGSFTKVKAWARAINTEIPSTGNSDDPCPEDPEDGNPCEVPDDPTRANFPLSRGTELWVMGYKTEKNQPSFSLSDSDDRLEVLGGFANQRAGAFKEKNDGDDPDNIPYSMIVLKESAFNAKTSYIGFTSGITEGPCTDGDPEFHFEVITRQKINGVWQETPWSSYPKRRLPNRCNDVFVPLFVANSDSGVRFVDDDSGCTSSCGLSWEKAHQTISAAINDFQSRGTGGTIYIGQGSYSEDQAITIQRPIKIIGAGMGVTTWKYNNAHGAALRIEGGGSGSVISKLSIRPTEGAIKTSVENGGIYLDGANNILIDKVWLSQFGNNDQSSVYSPPEAGDSYCLKVAGAADNIKVINSEFTFCNNALVILGLNGSGSFEFDRSVTHYTRAGPALYVDDSVPPTAEIRVTNSWFAMKNSATPGQEYSKYLVYLRGGHAVFSNTQTELDVTPRHNMKSHHIYVGTDNNRFVNHMFISGENPDSQNPCKLDEETNPNDPPPLKPDPPYSLAIAGNNNNLLQHIGTSEGCGEPEVHDIGLNNTNWTGYPPATP